MKTMKILLIHTNGTSIDVDMSYKFKLDEELDFEKHRNDTGCDAPDITMYKAEDGMLKVLYCVGNYDNVPAYTQIMRQKQRESYK